MGVDFTRYKRSAFDSGEDDIVRQVLKPQPYGMIEPLWGAYILVLDNCKSQLADTLGNTNELEKISEALHYAYRLFYCKPSFKSKEIEKKCIEDIKLHRENMAPFLDRVK